MSHPTHCPNCDVSWDEEETIYEHFLRRYKDKDKALSSALMYGCTPETPKHFSKNVMGLEIQGVYDGTLYWHCTKCNHYTNRFTGEIFDSLPKKHSRS